MRTLEWLAAQERKLSVYGLGVFMIVAGASKFFILEYWTGYEPQILVQLVPLAADQLTLLGGVLEALLGFAILTGKRTKYFSAAVSFWLTAITLQVANLGLWDLAIRDLGLSVYSYTVTVRQLNSRI